VNAGNRKPVLGRFGSVRENFCVVSLDLLSHQTTQEADLQDFLWGETGLGPATFGVTGDPTDATGCFSTCHNTCHADIVGT
jgi:hypothetical protein